MFEQHGYNGARLSMITSRSGLTMGAIYFHFTSKDDLARAVMAAQADDLVLPDGERGLQRLIDITLYLASELQRNVLLRAGVRLAIEQGSFGVRDSTPYLQWVDRFRDELGAAEAVGDLLPEVVVADVAQLLVSSYSGTQLLSEIATDRADLPERIVRMWTYLLPGIATPEARTRLRLEPSVADRADDADRGNDQPGR